MTWRLASFFALALWGTYGIFGNKATEIHGAKVSMAFEALMMIVVAGAVMYSAVGDLSKVTGRSMTFAIIMGLMSAGGMYMQLHAMQLAPTQLPMIFLISGMFPIVTVIVTFFLGTRLAPTEWTAVAFAAAALVLVNWPKN